MQKTKFKRALSEALTSEFENMIPQTEEHEFSPEFEKKMDALIHRKRNLFRKIMFNVSKVAVCILASVGTISLLSRNKVEVEDININNFNIDPCKEYSVITLTETDPDAPLTIKDRYQMTYDLSDYEVIDVSRDAHRYGKYCLKDNVQVIFNQYVKKDLYTHWNTEGSVIQKIRYRDTDAIYFYNDFVKGHYLIWEDDDYIFSVIVGEGDKEMLFEIADSVQKVE